MNGFSPTTPTTQQYLLLFRHGPGMADLTRDQKGQILTLWGLWTDRLFAQKKMLSASPLADAGKVISQKKKEVVIADGPFTEAKEAVGGYFLLEVVDEAEALEIAGQCPGLPYGIRVEVRPVVPSCQIFADAGLEMASISG